MRFLIVRSDRLGDMILTLPMARVLGEKRPDNTIIVLASDYNATLAELCPDVDEAIIVRRDATAADLARAMRKAKADIAFFPAPSLPLAFAGWLARIPARVGTGYRWYSFLFNKKVYEHRKTAGHNEAEYNVRMLKAIGIEASETPLPHLNLPDATIPGFPHSYCVLHIPTGGSAPAWDTSNFIRLAEELADRTDWHILLTGTPSEREFLFTIAGELKHLAPKVHIRTSDSLIELAHALGGAKLVVSGSTGPGHIAAALGTPAVGLFPMKLQLSRERWGFRGRHVRNLAPLLPPKSECPRCKECSCITTISVGQVLDGIKSLGI